MKAITVPRYGSSEVLVLSEVEAPVPREEDVLVDVVAASLNAADGHVVHGTLLPIRLAFGLRRPAKIRALGADVAGRVRAVGARVSGFSVGDAVIADLSGHGFGACAEQVCAPARVFVKKPASLSFTEAAALPMAGMTALMGLREVGAVRAGEQVLVVGAAGGIGSFAVQIARVLGAEVTAACRAEKADVVSALGVNEVVDTSSLDEALARGTLDDRFDVVFDCAAYRSPFAFRRVLRQGGRYVLAGGAMTPILQTAFLGPFVGLATGRRFLSFIEMADPARLAEVVALAEAKKIRPVIDRVFPLAEGAAALRPLEGRRTRGKIVVSVAEASAPEQAHETQPFLTAT